MVLQRILIITTAIFMLTTSMASESSAQARLKRNQPVGRFLGLGWGLSGYHYCDPGPNSDYYNPYSARNSLLLSHQQGFAYPQQIVTDQFGTPVNAVPPTRNSVAPVIDYSAPPIATPGFRPASGQSSVDRPNQTDQGSIQSRDQIRNSDSPSPMLNTTANEPSFAQPNPTTWRSTSGNFISNGDSTTSKSVTTADETDDSHQLQPVATFSDLNDFVPPKGYSSK